MFMLSRVLHEAAFDLGLGTWQSALVSVTISGVPNPWKAQDT